MSGRKSRNKGYIGEYKARKFLESKGFVVEWLAEDPSKPDLKVEGEYWEVKYRASVSKQIYDWLEEKNADCLMVKRVNKKDGRSYPWLLIHSLEEKE